MLPKYKNILIASDLSPNAAYAFRHAVMLSRHDEASIHLVHVVTDLDAGLRSYVGALVGESQLQKLEKSHEDEARQTLEQELEHFARTELQNFPEDLARFAGAQVIHGHPASGILKLQEKLQADVIVMGTHGKGFLDHTFLGSVAEKVIRKAPVPVFVVPHP